MSPDIDVKDMIQQTTSEVQLEDLAKRGFKRVKVLDKEAVNRMIADAVDKVVADRLKIASGDERQQIQREVRADFDSQLKVFHETARQINSLQTEVERLRGALVERETELKTRTRELETVRNTPAPDLGVLIRSALMEMKNEQSAEVPNAGMAELKSSIEALAKSVSDGIASGGRGGKLDDIGARTDAASIRALINRTAESASQIESNLEHIEVQKARSKGVGGTLEKLKSLGKKGG